MKKLIRPILLILMLSLVISGCENQPLSLNESGRPINIALVQFNNDKTYTDIKDAYLNELNELGYKNKLNIIFKSAKNDLDKLNSIYQELQGKKLDLIVPIGEESSVAAKNYFAGKVPIIFMAVENPVALTLMDDKFSPSPYITGVTNYVPADSTFTFIMKDLNIKTIKNFGLIYGTREVNPIQKINDVKNYLANNSISFEDAVVADPLDVSRQLHKMLTPPIEEDLVEEKLEENPYKINALYISNDSVIKSSIPQIEELLEEKNIVVYVGSEDVMLKTGSSTIVPKSESIGIQTAQITDKFFNGTPLNLIPCEDPKEFIKITNVTQNENNNP